MQRAEIVLDFFIDIITEKLQTSDYTIISRHSEGGEKIIFIIFFVRTFALSQPRESLRS